MQGTRTCFGIFPPNRMFSECQSALFCSVLPQLTSLITKRVASTTVLALCTSLLHQRRRRCQSWSTFSNIPHACWRVFLRRRLPPLSFLTRFLHVPFSSHANAHLFQCEGEGGGARARWLTCSESMLAAHFDMTFKIHSLGEQMMLPNAHRGARLPWYGVYCGATAHLYPGPLFICHYKFSRPFCR